MLGMLHHNLYLCCFRKVKVWINKYVHYSLILIWMPSQIVLADFNLKHHDVIATHTHCWVRQTCVSRAQYSSYQILGSNHLLVLLLLILMLFVEFITDADKVLMIHHILHRQSHAGETEFHSFCLWESKNFFLRQPADKARVMLLKLKFIHSLVGRISLSAENRLQWLRLQKDFDEPR